MSAILSDPTVWTDAEPLECCSVVPEAPSTATISFVAPNGALFRYLPGQFLTLELPLPGGR
jgi:ferredoxin-NADP reductase